MKHSYVYKSGAYGIEDINSIKAGTANRSTRRFVQNICFKHVVKIFAQKLISGGF